MNSPNKKRGRPRKAKAVPKLPNELAQDCSSAAASALAKPAFSVSSLPIKKAGRGRPKGQKQPPKPKSGRGRGRPPKTGGRGAAKEAVNKGTGMRGRPKKKVANVEPAAALTSNQPQSNANKYNNNALLEVKLPSYEHFMALTEKVDDRLAKLEDRQKIIRAEMAMLTMRVGNNAAD